MKLALPFIAIGFPGSRYCTFKNAPIFPAQDLHFHQSYNVRKSFRAWYWKGFYLRLGWYYVAHWDNNELAIPLREGREAFWHIVMLYAEHKKYFFTSIKTKNHE